MNIKELLIENSIPIRYGYHVTSSSNISSIMKNGLEPRVPEDYGAKGDVKGVYLFKTLEDVQTALEQWLGERIEEWEEETGQEYDEVILKIDMSNIDHWAIIDTSPYEWTITDIIPPEAITVCREDHDDNYNMVLKC